MSVRFRIPEMEGRTARWYARQRAPGASSPPTGSPPTG